MSKKKSKKSDQKVFQRLVVIVSGLALLGSGIYSVVFFANSSPSSEENNAQHNSRSIEERLEEQARGYQLVLEKEPNNRFALENLVRISVQLNDYQRALEPMKQLIELDPNNGQYQIALEEIQSQLNPIPSNTGESPETPETGVN